MPSLFYAGQPDYIEKLNTLATAASMTNGTVAASFLSLAVTGTATAASFVGPLTGNASTATTLATARNINGVAFNGSADITITAAAGTLTGTTLAANVTSASLDSITPPWWGLSVTGIQTITANSWTPALVVTQNGSGYALTVSGAASFGGAVTAAGFTNTSSSITNTAANAGLEIGAKASANTPFIDFNSSGNSNDYDARVIASAGTTTGTGNLTVQANSLNVAGALGVTGQASFAAGTAAAPSVKVGGEQNGLYSDGAGSLSFATAGARVVRMGTVGGTGNYLRLDANNTPMVTAVAGATNADIGIASAGTGSVLFATNGSINNLQARVLHTANAVNYWQLTGSSTGSAVWLDVRGSDSNVSALYSTRGTGSHTFASGNSATTQFVVNHTASAVNYIQATGAATGNAPNFAVGGSDANVYFNYYTKGNGAHQFLTGGGLQLLVGHVASAVNYWDFTGAATGGGIRVDATGSDSGVNGFFVAKGSGVWNFCTSGTSSNRQFQIGHIASAVNYLQATGSTTGNAVTISASGSDSNIDFAIAPKGTGVLRFGTHSALAAETVTGYITIKDAAGNSRKLAVLS